MSKKPETLICDRIRQWVRDRGGFAIHFPGGMLQVNQPDLWGAIPFDDDKFILFVAEVKIPGENPRDGQNLMLELWNSIGFNTWVVHSLEEFIGLAAKPEFITERVYNGAELQSKI